MRTLYFECQMGAAGDMLMSALYELLEEEQKKEFISKMEQISIGKVQLIPSRKKQCGIIGTQMQVIVDGKEEGVYQSKTAQAEKHFHYYSDNVGVHGQEHTHNNYIENDSHIHRHNHVHNVISYNGEIHDNIESNLNGQINHHIKNNTITHHESEKIHTHSHFHDEDNEVYDTHKNILHQNGHIEYHSYEHIQHGKCHTHYQHSHMGYEEVVSLIDTLDFSENVKQHSKEIYRLIGESEAKVHETTLEHIHFHEVGTKDGIVDVVGCVYLLDLLNVDEILCSPVAVGSGTVTCAHGVLPVPAPATVEILKGIPIYSGNIRSELCTPTGASILKHYGKEFGEIPIINIKKIGYGFGKKEFEVINCVRAFLGERKEDGEFIWEISCNLDDMTPEEIGYATTVLFKNGALDVYTTPIVMKKNRLATMITCLCKEEEREIFGELLLKHTTTLGIRYHKIERKTLNSTIEKIETSYGNIKMKKSCGYGITKEKLEYDDISRVCEEYQIPFHVIKKEILKKIKKI